jgi:lysine-specific demethylase 8
VLEPIQIPKITPPTDREFREKYLSPGQPVVIKGLIEDWPAAKLWTPEYFAQNFGDAEASFVKVKSGINSYEGAKLDTAKVSKSISKIVEGNLIENATIASCIDHFPDTIRRDYTPPRYCANGKFLTSHLFIAPKDTVTPIHQDLPENLYVIVSGIKRVTLFPPYASVYPNPRFSRAPHYAQIDVENPDYDRFPRSRNAQPFTVDVMPGETLFIPSFWWHHVRNIEPTIALNFWWSQGWKVSIAVARDIYKMFRRM